jgi:DMSO/TMAO reductase YedYZ molybdopterin-dependent catalytic subunit
MLGSTLRRLPLVLLLLCACARPEGEGAVAVAMPGVARTLTKVELAGMPVAEVTLHERTYTGVRLRDLLAALEADAGAPLQASAADGYAQALAPEVLERDDALLAYAVDGGPLPDGEGPLRLVVPGSPGLSLKRLVKLARP